MEKMTVKEAYAIAESRKKQVKRQNEHIKENYDRVSVTLPKGTKERIKKQGFSVNGFINSLILEKLEELENSDSSNSSKE